MILDEDMLVCYRPKECPKCHNKDIEIVGHWVAGGTEDINVWGCSCGWMQDLK